MKQFSSFIFDSHAFDPEAGKIELRYSLDNDAHFTETVILPPQSEVRSPKSDSLLALHLIGGISYYKTCLPKTIIINDSATSLPLQGERPSEGDIRRTTLTQEQASFWNTVYEKGLGEFFFRNQLDFRGLINFPSIQQTANPSTSLRAGSKQQTALAPKSEVRSPKSVPTPYALRPTPKLLVPLGGGKDSTVTVELLKQAGYDITLFRVGHHPIIEQTAKITGLPLLTVERRLDPLLFRLNTEGALNGHVPITAYLSFLSVVIAEIYGFDAVVMSNEQSASEGNVPYLGGEINHQWSKSLEFERMLRRYLRDTGSAVQYFSLLRPLSELSIAKNFGSLPQYFSCTTSCNTNWRLLPKSEVRSPKSGKDRWCGTCPKCAFTFSMLAAFLPEETLLEIFGKNLFDEESLQLFYRQLLGLEGFKPFECVGTPEETKAAFLLAHERGDLDDSKAMQLFLKEVQPKIKDPKKLIEESLAPSSDHCIPAPFLTALNENQ